MTTLIEALELVTNFYTYEGVVRALDRVSFKIERGEVFGLVGESGCGKSMTARSLMRIVPAPGRIEGGRVYFHTPNGSSGVPPDLLAQTESVMQQVRGNQISMIFQEPGAALNPLLSIGAQVAESFLFHRQSELCQAVLERRGQAANGRLSPLSALYRLAAGNPDALLFRLLDRLPLLRCWRRPLQQEAFQRAETLLGRLGIADAGAVARRFPHQLSGGMKQRAVIAMALACRPQLLIADEATSNLDVTIQAQILALLRKLMHQGLTSILLITHDLGVVGEMCDRVAVMYAGQVCEVAPAADLFGAPRHPYTRALLKAVPRMEQTGRLDNIPGSVPNLVEPPPGCRFHPRCPHAMGRCGRAFPHTVAVNPGHQVACYLYTDQAR